MQNSEENISEKKRKIFVLDTSVIIDDPKCLEKLGENDVVIPIIVLEELDNIKKEFDDNDPEKRKYRTPEVRFAAREFLRVVVDHKIGAEFDDAKSFPNGVKVKIDSTPVLWTAKLKRKLQAKKNDNDIILTALRLSELKENSMGKREIILITQDINMQAKAQALGIVAQGFYSNEVKIEEEYNGKRIVQLGDILKEESSDEMKALFEKEFTEYKKNKIFFANETIVVPFDGGKHLYAVIKQKEEKDDASQVLSWVNLEGQMNRSYCSPKNIEQAIAFNYLMDPSIEILTITGKAGTGKTLLSLMAGWQQLYGLYDTIYVYRPYVEVLRRFFLGLI
jgi:PhoH-like ATPase